MRENSAGAESAGRFENFPAFGASETAFPDAAFSASQIREFQYGNGRLVYLLFFGTTADDFPQESSGRS